LAVALGHAAADDELGAGLLGVARAAALGEDAGRAGRGPVALRAARAAAHRVGVVALGHAAGDRPAAEVARQAGLAEAAEAVVGIAGLADRRHAGDRDAALLARGEDQGRVVALLVGELRIRPGRAAQLGPAPRDQLDAVDVEARGDVAERHGVADAGLHRFGAAADDRLPDLQAVGGDDVALDPVGIFDQGDMAGAVGVVLDPHDLPLDAVAVLALEVDEAVAALGPAAAAARRDHAPVVPAALLVERAEEALFRLRLGDLGVHVDRGVAAAGAGGLVDADGHGWLSAACGSPLEQFDGLPLGEADD